MDLYKAIRELVEEKKRIDRIIASLEAMLAKGRVSPAGKILLKEPPKRRGRKSMSADERKQVSERMARYWAQKRAKKERRAGRDTTAEETGNPAATS